MKDMRVTVASLRSELVDTEANLDRVRQVCVQAAAERARLVFLPELMLTGHGGHPRMAGNAEPVPDGPLAQAVVQLSARHGLCVCVGLAERCHGIVYNGQMVADRGEYIGLQRKVNLSGDEYCHFGAGERVEVFDIGEVRFGVTICYDNHFPELALLHECHGVELILAPHAGRSGKWPSRPTRAFRLQKIRGQQESWERTHRARAVDHNVFVLVNNAVGPSTRGLRGVVANHAGTVMGVAPDGEVFLRTSATGFVDEVTTVELDAARLRSNHAPSRNRRWDSVLRMLGDGVRERRQLTAGSPQAPRASAQ